MQGPQKKRLTLQELQEERRRLVEIQRINKLKSEQKKLEDEQRKVYQLERQQKIQDLKTVGRGVIGVVKAGHQKISAFEQSRVKAKPIIKNIPKLPQKKFKSVYD